MQYISLSELPLFIKKGDLYKSFPDKTSFTINRKMNFDLNINSSNDLYFLLDTLLFWQVKDFPNEVYDYVFKNKKNIDFKNHMINDDKYNYAIGLDEIEELKLITELSGEKLISKIIEKGYINLLKYLIEIRKNILNDNLCGICALYGQLEILKYLHEIHDYPLFYTLYTYANDMEYSKTISCASNALINGHYDCVKYIYENGCKIDNELYEYILYSLPESDNHNKCKKYIESFIK